MKPQKAYMKYVMEEADDAPLLDFGFPDKIQIYSSIRSWFVKVTEKALLLISFPTAIIMIMLIVKPKDWPIGEQVAFCLIPSLMLPVIWIISFIQGYILPKRVNKIFNEIADSAFAGFQKTLHDPGYMQLVKDDEEWHMEFYQEKNTNLIELQSLFKSEIEDKLLSEKELSELFHSFCERRNAMLKNKSLARYVGFSPYSIRVTLPMRIKLTDADYRTLYNDLKTFIKSIDCKLISLESY